MELDEEADDPDDPPRLNTFLVSTIERMQVGGDTRVAEDTPVTQTHHSDSEVDLDDDIQVDSLTRADREPTSRTHYEMDTTDLDMLIQPRAPPQSQSTAPPSSWPRGPPPRPPSLSKSSSTHRHGLSHTQVAVVVVLVVVVVVVVVVVGACAFHWSLSSRILPRMVEITVLL
ncbi:hypothetical protein Taro_038045 [Colocasia esculenta]|uniref:Uncharacterized protein n=1 Tax=Colocasia esculenta TaxID=4460 RepID=A0A843WRI4_COLES|nr:hypothetical protein [Colocasia esculenta]